MTLDQYIEWLLWRKYIWDRERLEKMGREIEQLLKQPPPSTASSARLHRDHAIRRVFGVTE